MSLPVYGNEQLKINVTSIPEELTPGDHFTIIFEANSNVSEIDLTHPVFNLPADWKVIVQKVSQKREDSTILKYLYTVQTPVNSPALLYPVTFNLEDYTGEVISTKTVQVQLREIRKIEVIVASQPKFVKEGGDLFVEYIVQNLGNRSEKIRLATSRGVIQNSTDTLTIGPSSYRKIVIKYRVPETEQYNWNVSSDLQVFTGFQTNPILQSVSIPVYSSNVKKIDPFLRFPVQAGIRFLRFKMDNQSFGGMQYFVDGKGFIDFAKKHDLEVLLRGPNQFAFPMVASYDQYYLRYAYNSKLNIELGDYSNRLNNLIEFSRFGRGFKVDYEVGKKHQFEAFFNKARFFANQRNSFGGSYKFRFQEGAQVEVSYMHKELTMRENQPFFNTNIIGVSTKINRNSLILESEAAVGQAADRLGFGFFNNAQYTFKKLQLRNQIIYASKSFYGFYNNSMLFGGGVSYSISSKISIGVNINYSRVNPSLDVLEGSSISPISFGTTAFASYNLNQKSLLLLNYTMQEQEDRQEVGLFHYKEDFGSLSYQFNGPAFNMFLQTRMGSAVNYLAVDNRDRKRSLALSVQPSFRLTPWLWLGGNFEYQRTAKFSQVNALENLFFYGGNVRVNYKKYLSLSFMYRNNYAPDELFEKRSFIDGSVTFDANRHQFSFTASKTYDPLMVNISNNQLFYSLKYTLKLGVPVAKRRDLGNVRGRVISSSSEINNAGIVLQMGQYKVLTDANGFFSFPNITPDTYYIQMEDETNPAGVIATTKTPVKVDVNADLTKLVEIRLVQSGSVSGQVVMEGMADESELAKVPLVYIKLTNGEEKVVTTLDAHRNFSFKEVKPGRWQVSLIVVGNSSRYEIVNQQQEIEIKPKGESNVTFSIRSIERKIYFSDTKFNLSSTK